VFEDGDFVFQFFLNFLGKISHFLENLEGSN
jgi:hypothetical protein